MARGFKVIIKGWEFIVTLPGGRMLTGNGTNAQDALAKANEAGASAPENAPGWPYGTYGTCGTCGAGGLCG
ncbi:MAG: hypothetical protein WCI67_23225, partial [Chloroflexales bacterium]